jgi:hypothetical protein
MSAFDCVFYDTTMGAFFGALDFAELTGGDALCIGPDATRGSMMATQIFGSDEAAQGHAHWGRYNEFMGRLIQKFNYPAANALNGPPSVKWFLPADAQSVMDDMLADLTQGSVTFMYREQILEDSVRKDTNGFTSITFKNRDDNTETVITSGLWVDCSPLGDLYAVSGGFMSSVREGRSQYNEFVGGNQDFINGTVQATTTLRDSRGSIYKLYEYPGEAPDYAADLNTEPYNIRPVITQTAANMWSFGDVHCKPPGYNKNDFREWINYLLATGATTAAAVGISKGSTATIQCTISIASPAVITKTAHGLTAGAKVYFFTTGALPTGLTADIAYYVIASGLTTDTFQVSATVGGSAVNTSGTQSGTQSYSAGTFSNQIIKNGVPLDKFATNSGDIGGRLAWEYPRASFERREELKWEFYYQWLGKIYTAATASELPAALRNSVASYGLCKDEYDGSTNKPYYMVAGMPELLYTRGDRRIIGRRVITWPDVWGNQLAQDEPEREDTFSTATFSSVTSYVTDTAHNLQPNFRVKFTKESGATLPPEVTEGTVYRVHTVIDANRYSIKATLTGSPMTFSATSTGTIDRQYLADPLRTWPYTNQVVDALWWGGYAFDIHHGRDAVLPGGGLLSTQEYPHGFEGASYIGIGLDNIRPQKGVCDNLIVSAAVSCSRPCWAVLRLDPGYAAGGNACGILMAYCFLNNVLPGALTYNMVGQWMRDHGAPHSAADIGAFPSTHAIYY